MQSVKLYIVQKKASYAQFSPSYKVFWPLLSEYRAKISASMTLVKTRHGPISWWESQ